MKQAIAFLLIMFSMVLFSLSASAATFRCSLKSMSQNFESADLVFSGVVVKQADDNANGVDSEFKVSALWKGANSQYVNVIINKPNGMRLSDDFQQGEAYLIFAHKQEGKFYSYINTCNYTIPLAQAQSFVEALNYHQKTGRHFAPSCEQTSFEENLRHADIVATGTIAKVEEKPVPDSLFDGQVVFVPTKIWKGEAPKEFTVSTLIKSWNMRDAYQWFADAPHNQYLLLAKTVRKAGGTISYEQSHCWGFFSYPEDSQEISHTEKKTPIDEVRKYFGEVLPDCEGDTKFQSVFGYLGDKENMRAQCFFNSIQEKGASKQWLDNALLQSVNNCKPTLVKKLIEFGANVNSSGDLIGLMPRAITCTLGPIPDQTAEIVDILVKNGCSLQSTKHFGITYLDFAKGQLKALKEDNTDGTMNFSGSSFSYSKKDYKKSAIQHLSEAITILEKAGAP